MTDDWTTVFLLRQAGGYMTEETQADDPRERILRPSLNDREEQSPHKFVMHPGMNDRCVDYRKYHKS